MLNTICNKNYTTNSEFTSFIANLISMSVDDYQDIINVIWNYHSINTEPETENDKIIVSRKSNHFYSIYRKIIVWNNYEEKKNIFCYIIEKSLTTTIGYHDSIYVLLNIIFQFININSKGKIVCFSFTNRESNLF